MSEMLSEFFYLCRAFLMCVVNSLFYPFSPKVFNRSFLIFRSCVSLYLSPFFALGLIRFSLSLKPSVVFLTSYQRTNRSFLVKNQPTVKFSSGFDFDSKKLLPRKAPVSWQKTQGTKGFHQQTFETHNSRKHVSSTLMYWKCFD